MSTLRDNLRGYERFLEESDQNPEELVPDESLIFDMNARTVKWLKDVLADEGAGRSSDHNRKRRAESAKAV